MKTMRAVTLALAFSLSNGLAYAEVVCPDIDSCVSNCGGLNTTGWDGFIVTNAPNNGTQFQDGNSCNLDTVSDSPYFGDAQTEMHFPLGQGLNSMSFRVKYSDIPEACPGFIGYQYDCSAGCWSVLPPVVADSGFWGILHAKGASKVRLGVSSKNGTQGIPWYTCQPNPKVVKSETEDPYGFQENRDPSTFMYTPGVDDGLINYLDPPFKNLVTLLTLSWIDANGFETWAEPVVLNGVLLDDPDNPALDTTVIVRFTAVQINDQEFLAKGQVSYQSIMGARKTATISHVFSGELPDDGDPGVIHDTQPNSYCLGRQCAWHRGVEMHEFRVYNAGTGN